MISYKDIDKLKTKFSNYLDQEDMSSYHLILSNGSGEYIDVTRLFPTITTNQDQAQIKKMLAAKFITSNNSNDSNIRIYDSSDLKTGQSIAVMELIVGLHQYNLLKPSVSQELLLQQPSLPRRLSVDSKGKTINQDEIERVRYLVKQPTGMICRASYHPNLKSNRSLMYQFYISCFAPNDSSLADLRYDENKQYCETLQSPSSRYYICVDLNAMNVDELNCLVPVCSNIDDDDENMMLLFLRQIESRVVSDESLTIPASNSSCTVL
jgi:hypothetical protein